jgi:phage/plasmid-like protein (TIGR03299 family)
MPAAVETMAYGRGIPWHGLGTKTDRELSTAAEMLDAAGLDWEVAKVPVRTMFDGNDVMVPNTWASVRQSDGSVLGVVGDSYQILQNRAAFEWADTLVDSGAAKYETAGSLFGGARVFLSMELPEGVSVPGDAGEVKPYILITNGHDGRTVLQASVTMVRVVCANTWTLALSGATRTFRIRHSGSVDGKLAAAREALGVTFTYTARFGEVAEVLSLQKVSDRQIDDILRKAFPIPETQDTPERIEQSDWWKVRELYRTTENLNPIRGTAWGVLQAAGEYLDHEVAYHGRRFADEDVRMDSILYDGPAALRKQKVLTLLQDLPKVRRVTVPA